MSDAEMVPEAQALEERAARVFKMRLAGTSARSIAKQFGITVADVNEIVERRMVRVDNRYRAAAMALDLERLETLLGKFMSMAAGGDVEAGSLCIRALARRAAVLGYDAPMRIDASLEVIRPETSTEYCARVLDELQGQARPAPGADGEPGKPN
jgi:DNA-binding CsgD family transcriptional regulator